jgi:hypothetical protein
LPRSSRDGRRPTGLPARGRGRSGEGDLSRLGVQDRRLSGRLGAPYLVPLGLAIAAAVGVWLGWGRLTSVGSSLESPETQVRKALLHQDRAQLADVYGFRGGGTVDLHPVRFEDVAPTVADGRATVVAMLRAEGRVVWRDQDARLAYLGRERFHMKPCSIALWCGEGDQFDRLRGVLLALFRRHDAWQQRDAAAYGRLLAAGYRDGGEDRSAVLRRVAAELPTAPSARIVAWQIRVDREGAEVGEDLELAAGAGARRVERHVYRLAREGERWVFAGGV